MLILLAGVALALLAIQWVMGRRRLVSRLNELPGFRWHVPFLGDIPYLILGEKRILITGLALFDRFGRTFNFWLGPTPFVVLSKPEDFEIIIGSGKFNNKPKHIYGTVETFFGSGLATINGEVWRAHRKHITHAFHFRVLEMYLEVFTRKANLLVDKFKPLANGTSFNVFPHFAFVTNETIFETAFGLREDERGRDPALSQRRQEFVDAMEFAFDVLQSRVLHPWLLVDFIFNLTETGRRFREADKMIDEFADLVIRAKRAEIARPDAPRNEYAFIELMMRLPAGEQGMNDAEIRGELRTMIAVQQTSATIMSFALLMLAIHPDVQDRVVEEVVDVLGEDAEDFSRTTSYQALQGMKYMERVLKETMRLYPVLPVFARDVTEDVRVTDFTIPAGCCVAMASVKAHRDPELFPDPEKFDPDRFLQENSRGRHPYAYLPFSAGARNCVGQKYAMLQMKSVLCTLLRRYRVLPGKGCARMEDIQWEMNTFMTVLGGFNIRLEPREPEALSVATKFAEHLGYHHEVATR